MRRLKISGFLFLILLLAGEAITQELEIYVMSFNIRYGSADDGQNHWNFRKDLVFDVIRQHSPDVIGLQEALHFQIDEIIENVPGYSIIGEGRDGGKKGEYSAILHKSERFDVDTSGTFWLSDTPAIPSNHWGNVCIRICTWVRLVDTKSGMSFYIYNTHLDHESQPSREKSVRLIANRILQRKHKDPFVLTGDFNAGEDNPALRYLKGEKIENEITPLPVLDAFRTLHTSVQKVGTFNGFKGRTDGAKIDYIFVPPDVKVLQADILRTASNGKYPSDHFPVAARLRFGAESGVSDKVIPGIIK